MRFCAFLYLVFQLLSSLLLTDGFAQSSLRLTTTNGLPSDIITGVEQDQAGFIWIATNDGLARYDGRAVKVFRHRPGDSLSLAGNKISELLPVPDGTFVVNTESGTVQRFVPRTEQFTTLLDRRFLDRNKAFVNRVQLSPDGRHLWGLLPNIRLIDYDLHRKTLRIYTLSSLMGSADEIDDFVVTSTGHVYGECGSGLFHLDPMTGRTRLIRYPFTKSSGNYWPIDYHRIVQGPNGDIAVFAHPYIALYNPTQNRFRTIPIPDQIHQKNIWYKLKTGADKRLYLGFASYLYRLDSHDHFTRIPLPEPVTTQTAPWLLDRSGLLWVGGRRTGVHRLDRHWLPFGFAPKQKSYCEDLLEQDLGVSLPDNYVVWDIEHWPRYALGPNRTGYLIDPEHVFQHQPARAALTELTALRKINGEGCCKLCLKVSRRGQIWFYSNYWGLVASEPDGSAGKLYSNSQLPLMDKTAGHDAADIQPLNGSVWVGSQYGLGLFRYDIARQRYDAPLLNNPKSANSLPDNSINCLSADPADSTVLWIGTAGQGLCRLDTRTLTFRRFGESDGFPNGTIVSLETDGQGMLWCATNQGLVRVNPQTLTWRHFTTADGLAESVFLQTSSARLPDGRLVFGTPNGRVIVEPAAIEDDRFEPPIVLTSLLINNKPVDSNSPEGRKILPVSINTLSELILNYTQNFLTLGFAGLHYGKAEKLNYRYQLAGVDDDWVIVGTQNTANYTGLAPGRYVFSVNSTRADGQWSRQVKRLVIVIKPPIWATEWAYLFYALTFGGLVMGFIRFRLEQARQQQEIILKRREAQHLRAVDEVKTRFFSNITHEFRTPLTLILAPTAQLLTNPAYDGFTRQTLATIHQHASQLLRLINQLLDLSKLEGGSMNVALSRGDALAFVQRLVSQFQPLAASRGIALHLQTAGRSALGAGECWLFDADKWDKIISNLLSNALKFTPAGGQVSLTMEVRPSPDATADQLVIELADTGIGLTPEQLSRIFERFYQVNDSPTRPYEGTGIGLSLVKELTDLLGGTIRVQSRTQPPTGTTFILTLPLVPATHPAGAPELILAGPQPEENRAASGRADTKPETPGDVPLVLVVEDHQELRQFIAGELLSRYRVLTAADGQEGWQICQRELPDVVIADVMMPRLDGYQLTQRIKSTLATNHLAVILLTARAAYESRLAGLERGADDYVTKPFQLDELVLRLGNLLTRQANLRANLHRQLVSGLTPVQEPVTDGLITQLHQIIESRLNDPTFGVEDLAQGVAMSRRTLHRKLRALAELSAHDFIRHYRLQRARQLLRSGRSIAQTAYDVGFESPAYFTKIFKETYQQTPSEFVGRKMDK